MLLAACGLARCAPDPLSQSDFDALYSAPLPAPADALSVFHVGHSLVGRDMPAMLQQLAGQGHSHASQLGWGTPLKAHWEPDETVNGLELVNTATEAREAIASGSSDAVVITEMVEIRDAIKYFNSAEYVANWARLAWEADPQTRVYLYESWHEITDPEGWLERLDRDLTLYWEGELLRRALASDDMEKPIYVIPAGQVFGRFVGEIEARGGVGDMTRREDLFALNNEGAQDPIHFNDIGAYLVALTHYAVLYQRNPVGLPHELTKADGTPAKTPGPEAARLMQEIVWEVVTGYPKTGVPQR